MDGAADVPAGAALSARCGSCISRRGLLRLGGVGACALTAGCDDPPIDLVSDETVEAMGLEAWQQMQAETRPTDADELQATLDRVATRLLRSAGEQPGQWEAVVFASPQINAFALPGNKIGIYEGMFDVIASEDQLAAIVGHEIGHLGADHAQERMNAQVAKQLGLRVIALVLDLRQVEYAREIAAALGLGIEYGLILPYSRDQELEADRLGLELMAQAGFRPEEAVTLWQRMGAATDRRAPEFLATHPAPDSRIEAIEEMLPTL